MIKIELYNDMFTIRKEDLNIQTYPFLISFECKMKIIIDNKVFYDDWINPLEFYYQFKNWYKEVCGNNFINYYHNTIDHDDNPIISFIFDENSKRWTLNGSFIKYCEEITFSTEDIVSTYKEFEKQLLSHVK